MTTTERMARYILEYDLATSDGAARREGIKFFADCFGCMIAGNTEKSIGILRDYSEKYGGSGVSTMLAPTGGLKLAAQDAARVNGAAAHVHDFDDVSLLLCGHPSVSVLPTALAVGEECHADGNSVLNAYMLGVDIMETLAMGLNPTAYERGWHTTTQFGTFGAAAAAGKLMGLSQEQLQMALGICASVTCGIRGNNGSMSKCLQPGQANANGIMAAVLARGGYLSNPDVMEGNDNYIQATVGEGSIQKMFDFMDSRKSAFTIPDMGLKLYPSCKCTNIGIDLARDLQKEHGFSHKDVESVTVGAQPFTIATLRYPSPETTLQGKFSMSFTVAQALVHGNVTMRDFEVPEISDPDVIDLMKRVDMIHDSSIANGAYTNDTYETNIKIRLKNGNELFKQADQAYGDPLNPCSMDDVREKFAITAGYFMTEKDAMGLYDQLVDMDKVADINAVMTLTSDAMAQFSNKHQD